MLGAKRKLMGVVSMDKGCETGKYTLFTRITSDYLDWIERYTGITP
jgi:secreted trypsin-like serine protease